MAEDRTSVEVLYDVDEMPPLREAVPLGLQHVLAQARFSRRRAFISSNASRKRICV